ncbi:MAG: RICIN domain-containing protein [Fibrobacterales bacterium]
MKPIQSLSKLKAVVFSGILMAVTTLSAQNSWETIDQTTLNTLAIEGAVSVASSSTGDLYFLSNRVANANLIPTLYKLVSGQWTIQDSDGLSGLSYSATNHFSVNRSGIPTFNNGDNIALFNGTGWDIVWSRTVEIDINGALTTDNNGVPYTVIISDDEQSIECIRFINDAWQIVGSSVSNTFETGVISEYYTRVAFDANNIPYLSYWQRSSNRPGEPAIAYIKQLVNNTWSDYAELDRSAGYLSGLSELMFTEDGTLYMATGVSYITVGRELYRLDKDNGEWIGTGARYSQTRGIGNLDWPAIASADGSVIYWTQQRYANGNAAMKYSTGGDFEWVNGTEWEASEFTDRRASPISMIINKYNNPVVAYFTAEGTVEIKKMSIFSEEQTDWDPTAEYQIVNKLSGKCLDVAEAAQWNGANIQQWDCYGGQNQLWSIVKAGEHYKIINKLSGKALDIAEWSWNNGGNIHQWDYVDGANQQWSISPISESYFAIGSAMNEKVIDVAAWSMDNGGNIHQWDFVNGDNQLWEIVKY